MHNSVIRLQTTNCVPSESEKLYSLSSKTIHEAYFLNDAIFAFPKFSSELSSNIFEEASTRSYDVVIQPYSSLFGSVWIVIGHHHMLQPQSIWLQKCQNPTQNNQWHCRTIFPLTINTTLWTGGVKTSQSMKLNILELWDFMQTSLHCIFIYMHCIMFVWGLHASLFLTRSWRHVLQ
jgi:hypothetical protein